MTTPRLTATVESSLRRAGYTRSLTPLEAERIWAELDAVRAERDAVQAEMDRLSAPGGQSLPDYWTAEKQLPFVATALNKAQGRAIRAEATLAAIRAWADRVLALLDAAPKDTP